MKQSNPAVSKEGKTAIVTLNRPDKLNALDFETLKSFYHTIKKIEHDQDVRCLIITGAGDKAFCAGVDLKDLNSLKDDKDVRKFVDMVHHICFELEKMDKPVIAAVNGYCLGGGCEVAMSCDIRIASDDAMFSQPEVKVGIIPGAGGTQRLPMLVGLAKAKEMIFTGEMINADEALCIGLVNKVVIKEDLLKEAKILASKINGNSHNAVKLVKRVLNGSFKATGYTLERSAFVRCFHHPDQKEGMDAFLKKRKPRFR